MNKMSLAAALAVGAAAACGAAVVEVSSKGALLEAVNNAKANDEIIIKASGSPYNFDQADFDTVAHLYAKVRITLRGETGNPADVVLVGNENRILYLSQDGNTIRDLTFKNGNCTKYQERAEDPKDYRRGGAICSPKAADQTTLISNCVFDSCMAYAGGGACGTVTLNNVYFGKYMRCVFGGNMTSTGNGGAVYQAYSFRDCEFDGNSAAGLSSSGGAVYGAHEITGSTFAENALTDTGNNSSFGGGAVHLPENTRYDATTVSNCTFAANSVVNQNGGALSGAHAGIAVVGCVFSNNCTSAGNGGALAGIQSVRGCAIVSNATSSASGFGGGAYNCTLTGCFVASNFAYRCGAVADSVLYSCTNVANSAGDFYETGPSSDGGGCYAQDCIFRDGGYNGKRIFGLSGFNRCRFQNIGRGYLFTGSVALTNCLFSNIKADGNKCAMMYQITGASSMINCTVVSNVYSVFASSCVTPKLLTVKNCFFFANKAADAEVDIDGTADSVVSSFSGCILAAASDDDIPGSNNLNYYGDASFLPGFSGGRADPENPFAITPRSPAYRKDGVVADWMATATDIRGEGFPRLRDGRVNIGCYQCWIKIPGFMVKIR